MADSASILGTIVAVSSSAAQLALTIFRLVHEAKDAPQILTDFRQELFQFKELLSQIEGILLDDEEKSEKAQEQLLPIKKLLENCSDYLIRAKHQFPEPNEYDPHVSLLQRLRLVVKKDAFVASRAHMQMVAQILTLQLQRIAIVKTFHISGTQDHIEESQARTEKEIQKLEPILRAVQFKLATIEKHISGDDDDSEDRTLIETSRGPEDFRLRHEQYLAKYARHMLDSGRQFEEQMKIKAQTAYGSDTGSQPGTIAQWRAEVATEAIPGGASDLRTPPQSIRSSLPPIQEVKADISVSFSRNPNFIRKRVDLFQKEVTRQAAAGAFDDARENQIKSINLLEELEASHNVKFEEKVPYVKKLAQLYMQDDTLGSYEEAANILKRLLADIATDNMEVTSALHQMLAVVYDGKKDWKYAELHAGIALDQRENLPGPPAALIQESAAFLIDFYEKQNDTDSASMAFALRASYSDYLVSSPSPEARRQQEPVRNVSGSSVERQLELSPEMHWLLHQGFGIGPRDYKDRLHMKTKMTPIITLIQSSDPSGIEMLRRLVDDGASINIPDGDKDLQMTPIMWAVRCKNEGAVKFLLNARPDTRIPDVRGRTALHVAMDKDSTSLAQRLYDYDAELIHFADGFGTTPLHCAVERKSKKLVTWLLNRRANVNVQDNDWRTPLHTAVYNDAIDLITQLLNHRPPPDLSLRNREGRTAIEAAKAKGKNSRLYHLLSHASSNASTVTSPQHSHRPSTTTLVPQRSWTTLAPPSPGRTSSHTYRDKPLPLSPIERSGTVSSSSTEKSLGFFSAKWKAKHHLDTKV
ncbi:uncharacterized protein KY384_003685 [Bacidia gigantensis]|uniref:uncharacterized protein n=1 Tax=Bacidia gigantensis TaxID=2732470 RepID=UPI001D050F32|nr:uncharacterized protein KY384_003685 [Bacidia gigantensis]KAG8532048.1 hypothetical protein KY384_003685 [Bacidia gigantensis]